MAKRMLTAAAAGLLALGFTTSAHAQSATEGSLLVGFERMFGFGSGKVEVDLDEGGESETEGTAFTLGSPIISPDGRLFIPRAGIDYVVSGPITVGGGFGFGTGSIDDDNDDDISQTAFLLAPRAGGLFMFNDTLGAWPRAGITFFHYSSSDDDGAVETSTSFTAWQLNLEAWLAIEALPSLMFLAGFYFDLPIGGSGTFEVDPGGEDQDFDISVQTLGISTAMVAVF